MQPSQRRNWTGQFSTGCHARHPSTVSDTWTVLPSRAVFRRLRHVGQHDSRAFVLLRQGPTRLDETRLSQETTQNHHLDVEVPSSICSSPRLLRASVFVSPSANRVSTNEFEQIAIIWALTPAVIDAFTVSSLDAAFVPSHDQVECECKSSAEQAYRDLHDGSLLRQTFLSPSGRVAAMC